MSATAKKLTLHRAISAGVVPSDYVGSLAPNALFGQIAIGKARFSMPAVFIAVVVVSGIDVGLGLGEVLQMAPQQGRCVD
jgi:hypothetical protein